MNHLGKVLTKILEVFHWVGTILMLAATLCSAFAPQWLGYFVGLDIKKNTYTELAVYGYEVEAAIVDGNVDMTTFMLFGIGAVVILALVAMIFRNLHLIFVRSEKSSPFVKDNIRMMKEIGIFSMAIPVIGLIMSIVFRLVIGVDVEVSVNQSGIIMGIIVLCMSQFFVHGAALEKEVEGLV